jgi:hypothetical protein
MHASVRKVVERIDSLLARKRGVSALHKVQLRRRRAVLVDESRAGARRFAQLTSEWIDLVVRPEAPKVTPEKGSAQLTPGQADRRAKGRWFSGHARVVDVVTGALRLRSLDVAKRERAKGGAEYLLVEGDLVVDGAVQLGRDTRSIYVVTGDLRAKKVVRGDAVLVVRGKVEAVISGKPGQGVLQVG